METNRNNSVLKNAGIIMLGILAIFILPGICDALLILSGLPPFPQKPGTFTPLVLVVSFIYRVIFVFVGGVIVRKLATMRLVLIFSFICFAIALYGVVAGWDLPSYPHWYPIGLLVLAFPAAWYGGRFVSDKSAQKNIGYPGAGL